MFGIFKKLFSKRASLPPAPALVTAEPADSPAPAPKPPASSPAPMRLPTPMGDMIALPLNEILSRLPNTLERLVLSRPGGTFFLPVSGTVEQLRTGAVRVPFGRLRESSPPGTFVDDATEDDSLIDLPLPLILAALGPGRLARRSDQKRTEMPAEVTGVFAAKLGPCALLVAEASAPAAAPVAPMPVTAAPAAPAPSALKPGAPMPVVSFSAAPKAPASAPLPFAAPKAEPPPPAAAPAPAGETVVTTLEAVSGAWPGPVRQEIQQFNLGSALISIPVSQLEPGMKTGRVVFTWAKLCGWLNVPRPRSAYDETHLELPLPVMAPLFLAKHRAPAPRKIAAVGENVPDLFAGRGRPIATPPTPAVAAAEAGEPWPPTESAPNVLGDIFGQPSKTDWTPREIAQGVAALPGVAGALLASRDGLLVAGQMPAPLNAETMAAFLPRIFTRLGGCAEEAQLGTLRGLMLLAGPAPCAIFKAGSFYLAVLGQAGQALPEPALERMAGALARQTH